MVANSGILSTLTTTASTQLVDKIDSPHSGLFKGLHSMVQGNYALKDGATLGFAHTFTTSSSNIQVALTAGKGFSNGQYIAVDALSATTINKPSSGAFYHWVAFADDGDGTGTISVVMGSSDGVIPDLTVTLTPISLIRVQSTDTHSTVAFQTFTTSKTENKLSLGYTNSNAYTPIGELSASASGLAIDGTTATIVTTPFMSLGNGATNAGELRLLEDTDNGAHYTGFKAPAAVTANTVYTLPADYPASNKVLQSTDAGVLSWETMSSGATLSGSTNNTITTVTGANAIQGEANLTFDGSTLAVTGALTTTTTATVGTDLTVTGGDVGFGNGQDATINVAATTSTTAGRDLTISAGSTSTNGNNIDGGDLILKSGGGDGTGTSIMTFHTKVSGTDTAAERMRIHTNGKVGINEAAPSAQLHIMQTSTGGTGLMIEEDSNTASDAPDVVLFRSKGSGASDYGADGDDLGRIMFKGVDDAGNTHTYADMYTDIIDASNGTEGGRIFFRVANAVDASTQGTLREFLTLRSGNATSGSAGGVVVNDSGLPKIDFRVESDTNANMLFVDSSENGVAIATASNDANAQLTVNGTIALIESSAPTATTNNGKIWTDSDNQLNFQDGDGTNAVLLKGGKHTIWVPAASMYPNTTNGCAALAQVELSNGPELKVLDFDASSDEFAQFTVAFPKSWNEGTITFQPFWTVTGTNTGTVAWQLAGVGFGDNDDINTAFGTAVATVAKAHSGTTNDMMVSAESGAVTISGASVDSVTYFQINRDISADDQTGDARLVGVKIFYTIDAGNDA